MVNTLRRFVKGDSLSDDGEGINKRYAVPVLIGGQVNRTESPTNGEKGGHPTGDNIREGDELLQEASRVIALSWAPRPHGEALPQGDEEETRWLRLSVPKFRGGRARGTFGNEVARVEWRPARAWMHGTAQQDAKGRVAWEKPTNPAEDVSETSATKPPKKSKTDEFLSRL